MPFSTRIRQFIWNFVYCLLWPPVFTQIAGIHLQSEWCVYRDGPQCQTNTIEAMASTTHMEQFCFDSRSMVGHRMICVFPCNRFQYQSHSECDALIMHAPVMKLDHRICFHCVAVCQYAYILCSCSATSMRLNIRTVTDAHWSIGECKTMALVCSPFEFCTRHNQLQISFKCISIAAEAKLS